MSERYDMIVIGGGSGGLVAAAGAAQLGAKVLLVEKNLLGGDCLYTGCVPSKTFIRSARWAREVKRANEFGFETVDWKFKDESFASITDRVWRAIKTIEPHDSPERFEKMGVEIFFGTPRFVSPNEIEVEPKDGSAKLNFNAKRFCISTGSRPAVPPIEGLKETGFITNEEVFHLKHLPESLVVLGGGAIGVELGQAFSRFGSRVTIVEMLEHLLPKEDEEVSSAIENILTTEGISVHTKTKAIKVRRDGDKKIITLEKENKQEEIEAEEILVATGRRPNIEGLNLEAAGVAYDKQRIITDEYLRTSQKHIFAAGDVTAHFLFTHTAAYEASLVVRNALFFYPLTQKIDFSVVPWAVFTDPEVARVGLTEKEAKEKFGDANVKIFRVQFNDNDRAVAEEELQGFAKIICMGRKKKIIGAHIIGAHAGELIQEVVIAIKQGLGITAIGGMIHAYPTLTQITQQAGVDAVLEQLSSPTVRKWMKRYLKIWR
jgi:dihydrolipoamide dehydrogenase